MKESEDGFFYEVEGKVNEVLSICSHSRVPYLDQYHLLHLRNFGVYMRNDKYPCTRVQQFQPHLQPGQVAIVGGLSSIWMDQLKSCCSGSLLVMWTWTLVPTRLQRKKRMALTAHHAKLSMLWTPSD